MIMLKHVDLFSGIGGFALAAKMAGGIETVQFCEIEPFCQKLLKQHFPGVPIHGDIGTLKENTHGKIDILTGGFPCQPYSTSGKQKGHLDERDKLPDMLRIIKEWRPTWVVAENSPNVLSMAFNEIKTELEASGYQVGEPLIIPACGIGAHHRRNRAWILSHSNDIGLQGGGEKEVSWLPPLPEQFTGVSEGERGGRSLSKPGMLRSYHGIPQGVDRIKGLGNAIYPPIAVEIFRTIKRVEEHNKQNS